MAYADWVCQDCGAEQMLDAGQPEALELYCCQRAVNAQGDCTDAVVSTFKRRWGVVSIGAVRGAGGSPGRYGERGGAALEVLFGVGLGAAWVVYAVCVGIDGVAYYVGGVMWTLAAVAGAVFDRVVDR